MSKRMLYSLIVLGFLLSFLAIPSTPVAAQWDWIIDQCQGVDHWWAPGDYPQVDPTLPLFQDSPSLGWIAITFDLIHIPEGSVWDVQYDNQWDIQATVDEYGRAIFYFGLWSYGSYNYTSYIALSDGTQIEGPSGTVVINANESLDCNLETLARSPAPPPQQPLNQCQQIHPRHLFRPRIRLKHLR